MCLKVVTDIAENCQKEVPLSTWADTSGKKANILRDYIVNTDLNSTQAN